MLDTPSERLYIGGVSRQSKSTTPKVPRYADDPIQVLIDGGMTIHQIAQAWGFAFADAVYRLKRYEYPPKVKTAQLMARTFGWSTGEVIDHWIQKVGPRP